MQTQNQYLIPIIHPAFELLKRSAKLLHFMAAAVILLNGLYLLLSLNGNKIMCYTQMVIAVDIFILVFFSGNLLQEAPRLNLIFRFTESVTLLGIGCTLVLNGHSWFGYMHLLAAVAFLFLFYREWRIIRSEAIGIAATGIIIPNLVKDLEISWNEIKTIIPQYHSIIIETIRNKKITFNLRQNLKIDELNQIDDFCRRHLVAQ
jgi:hypothetical protein